jgi:hypothetical protein
VLKSIDDELLARVRMARAAARTRVWDAGSRPASITLNSDATLLIAHSDMELAAGNYKHYGFHPICCYVDQTGEALAAILRSRNAGSNAAEDHFAVVGLALAQLPAEDFIGRSSFARHRRSDARVHQRLPSGWDPLLGRLRAWRIGPRRDHLGPGSGVGTGDRRRQQRPRRRMGRRTQAELARQRHCNACHKRCGGLQAAGSRVQA